MTDNTDSKQMHLQFIMRALNTEEDLAQLLIRHGYETMQAIAGAPVNSIASIDGLNRDIAHELKSRAGNWLAEHPEAIAPSTGNFGITENQTEIPAPIIDTPLKQGRGRPRKQDKKIPINLRIERETLSRLRDIGKGWQSLAGEGLKALLDEGRI